MFAIIDEYLKQTHPQMVGEVISYLGESNCIFSAVGSLQVDRLKSIPEWEIVFLVGVAQRYEDASQYCEASHFDLCEIDNLSSPPNRDPAVVAPRRIVCPRHERVVDEMKKFLLG